MPPTKRAPAPAKKATAPTKRAAAKKTAAPAKKTAAAKKVAAPAKKTVAKKVAAPAKKTVAKKVAAPARKAAAKKVAAPAKKAAAPAKKTVVKKTTAPAKKTVAKKVATPAKKAAAPAKKTVAKKVAAPARRTPAKKAATPTVTVQNVAEKAAETPAAGDRWRGRPVAAAAIRAIALSVPLLASVLAGVVLSRVIHRPSRLGAEIAWWLGILVASTIVLTAVDRVARRILPLATLLKLAMAFPDQAPSRFSVAARAGTTRSLQEQLRRAQEEGVDDEPAQAAHRILTLVGALGAHDRRTRGHSERVRAFNDLIAEELGLPQHDRDRLRWAALLHDIGKLHVPTRILNKPKKPTDKEWAILKSHPARGARIAAPLAGWLGDWAPTIEQHHERWDGAGYPNGLSGNDISLGARIVAVADAYEVMTAPRPYSRPVSAGAARAELARCAGAQFDPEVVRAFLNISIGRLRKVIGPIAWLAQLPVIGATPRLEVAVGAAGRQVATVAATATGTGVLAAAMLPQAAHAHHHHTHVEHLAVAASYSAPAHTHHATAPVSHAVETTNHPAAPKLTTRPAQHHVHAAVNAKARAATASAPAGNGTAQTTHASSPADVPAQASTPSQAPSTKPSHDAAPPPPVIAPTAPQQAPPPAPPAQPQQAAPPQQPTAGGSGPAAPSTQAPKPDPAPKDSKDPKPDPAPKDPKPTPPPPPPPPPPSDHHDDPQPGHGHDDHGDGHH